MKRLPGAGRKLTCEEFDTDLAGWIRTERDAKKLVSRHSIQIKAEEMIKNYDLDKEANLKVIFNLLDLKS